MLDGTGDEAGFMFGLSKTFLAAFAACVILFVAFPWIDLHVSSLFFSRDEGVFILREHPFPLMLYHAVPWAGRVVFVLLLVGLGVGFFAKKKLLGLGHKGFLYLLLAFLIGPLFLVNTLLKNHWGRARPYQVEEFGGPMQFSPAFVIAGQKKSNGSWPSGHAAFGFYFVAAGLVVKRRRALVMALACGFGALLGLARMVQGKHFLSDVVSAFLVVYATARLLYYLMYERQGTPPAKNSLHAEGG